VLLARDVGGDRPVRQAAVDLLPGLVRVGGHLAVNGDLLGESEVDVLGLECPRRTASVCREDDAVVAEADFHDVLHAGFAAGLDLFVLDLARGVRNVDRLFAETLAELLQTSRGATRLDDRRLEVRVGLAELLSHDVGVRQNRRRAGNLDLVASRRRIDGREAAHDGNGRRERDKLAVHAESPCV